MASSSSLIESQKESAEVYNGGDVCKQKSRELLEEMGLPKGIFPVDDIVELGRNRSTGFVWLKLKEKKEHKFKLINKVVVYDSEVSFFADEIRRAKKITGVKAKEMFLRITLSEIYIDDPSSDKIFFVFASGIKTNFPIAAFEPEDN